MKIIIGSARIDENGKTTGGKAGDQKQKGTQDYSGEVSMQQFYVSKKGWYIMRPKDPVNAYGIAAAMERACNNVNIGYNQSRRLEIIKKGTKTTEPCNCDCSSLVRQCVIEATGKDPGNFTTANEVTCLKDTGLFENKIEYKDGDILFTGDILVTKTKGHTVAVVEGYERSTADNNINVVLPTLKHGSRGRAVKLWQIIAGADPDGIFGNETLQHTISFQKVYGLKQDGVVSVKTWQAGLNSVK
jgi:peptidoglycan hydrolase-like protein with peptidoglycan-binding domain